MPDNVFGSAAEQDMLEPGCSVRRSNDEVRAMVFGARTNLVAGVADLQRRLDLNPLPISLLHEIEYLSASGFFGLLHEERKIVSRVLITRDVILDMNRMEKDQRRVELFR